MTCRSSRFYLAWFCMLAAFTLSSAPPDAWGKTVRADLAGEAAGPLRKAFVPAVGAWSVVEHDGRMVVKVDGSRFKAGAPAPELSAGARQLYGGEAEAFVKSVSGSANFPFAVFAPVENFREGEISLRFKPLAGKEDQAAGIYFGLKPSADALILRANALEDNLILFSYVAGKRHGLNRTDGLPTPTGVWHELKLTVKGHQVEGYLDGKLCLKHELPQGVRGRVGIWSKDDSVVLFDAFSVTMPD